MRQNSASEGKEKHVQTSRDCLADAPQSSVSVIGSVADLPAPLSSIHYIHRLFLCTIEFPFDRQTFIYKSAVAQPVKDRSRRFVRRSNPSQLIFDN